MYIDDKKPVSGDVNAPRERDATGRWLTSFSRTPTRKVVSDSQSDSLADGEVDGVGVVALVVHVLDSAHSRVLRGSLLPALCILCSTLPRLGHSVLHCTLDDPTSVHHNGFVGV